MPKVMCPNCGSPNLDTDAACYDCGNPIAAPAEEKHDEPQPE